LNPSLFNLFYLQSILRIKRGWFGEVDYASGKDGWILFEIWFAVLLIDFFFDAKMKTMRIHLLYGVCFHSLAMPSANRFVFIVSHFVSASGPSNLSVSLSLKK